MTFDALWHSGNPYVAFDEKRLEHFLTTWKAPEPKNFMYSNLGAGLLGTALRHKAGSASYEALLQTTTPRRSSWPTPPSRSRTTTKPATPTACR